MERSGHTGRGLSVCSRKGQPWRKALEPRPASRKLSPRPELSCLKIFERLDPVFRLAQGGLFTDCHFFVRSRLSVPWAIKLPLSVPGLSTKSCGSRMVSTRTMKLEDTVICNEFCWKQVI